MSEGDILEVTGGMNEMTMQHGQCRKDICRITNCGGIAKKLKDHPGAEQGPEGWMMAVTEGLAEHMT